MFTKLISILDKNEKAETSNAAGVTCCSLPVDVTDIDKKSDKSVNEDEIEDPDPNEEIKSEEAAEIIGE